MSYVLPPQATKAGAPTAADDSTKGYVIGSAIIDTSVSPRQVYICTSAAASAATWVSAGGVTNHQSLTNLGWSSSDHTGTTNSVACFDNTGAALTVQATVEDTVLTFSGGVLQFMAMAAAVVILDGRTGQTTYMLANTDLVAPTDAQVITGSFI